MNRRTTIVLLLLCWTALTLSGFAGRAQDDPTLAKGKLSKEQSEQLSKLERQSGMILFDGQFAESLRLAREALALREKWQGNKHWQTAQARHLVERVQLLADLPEEKQKKVLPAMRLFLEGYVLESRQQYTAAEAAFRKSLDTWKEVLGDKHPYTASSYDILAHNLNTQGKYAAALPLYEKTLDIRREVFGEKHPDTANAYDNVAAILIAQGKYAAALPLLEKALKTRLEVFGDKHPDTARSYNNVGMNLNSQAKHAQAQPLLEKALEYCRDTLGEKHPDTAQFFINVAGNLSDQGKYAAAVPLYQKGLDIRRELLGEKHPDTATCYNNMATNLMGQGKYTEAQALFEKALGIRRQVLGEKHPDTATSYDNLASNLVAQGKHAAALPLSQKALEIYREVFGDKHPDTAATYNNVAGILSSQGKHAAAQPLYQKALDICREVLGEKNAHTAVSYNNAATNLIEQGKYAAAQALVQKALDIFLEVHGAKHPHTALGYSNVALALHVQGQHAAAQALLQKALDIRLEVLGPKHPATSISYQNLAVSLNVQGKYAPAQVLLEKALDICREMLGEQHPDTIHTAFNLALSLYNQEKHAPAEKHLRAILLAHDIARLDRASSGFERALGSKLSPRPVLAAVLAERGEALEAWQQAEADFARGLLDDLADAGAKADEDPAVQLARLHKVDEHLVPLLTSAKLGIGQKEQRDDLLRQRQELFDSLSKRAAAKAAERILALEKIQQHLPADAALLFWIDAHPNYWACVVRREGPPRWEKLAGTGIKGAWTDADRALHLKLYDALAVPDQVAEGERSKLSGAFLKQRFEPLHQHLQGTDKLPAVRKLLVVPTGAMARVPLEALASNYTISYVPSASVFAHLAQQHRPFKAAPLLALGDPIFSCPPVKLAPPPTDGLLVQMVLPNSNAAKNGLQAGDVLLRYNDTPLKTFGDLKIVADGGPVKVLYWREGKEDVARLQPGKLGVVVDKRSAPEAVAAWRESKALTAALRSTGHQRLPATRFEVEALTRLVGQKQAKLLLGSEASEQALDQLGKGGLKQFRVLHFATHGDVDLVDPFRSALILAQDQLPDGLEAFRKGQKVYDGRLTVATILREWELDADLVVLSACQTGLGKSAEGEGLLGFAQAFLQKGARSVLLSRWKVDDTATALLMLRFYENALGKRKDLKAALGRAQALEEARLWLRNLSRADAERLAAGLTGGVLRGTERDELPLVKGKVSLPPGERPFAHPFYWASFVLVGDPN
jgi:tetratricopeptide (TPR) repeat protein